MIEGYKKRNDFDNTIFIITGDHHVTARQFGGYYNYHVPLIIYSPMLKSGRNMKGVVSQRDITPTFLSLLQYNYNIETPDEVTWLNSALDTSLTFSAHTFSPLQLIDHSIGGMLYKNYLLCEGILEEFTDGKLHKIDDPKVLQYMNRLLSLYRFLDSYAFNNYALIKNNNAYRYNSATQIIDIEDPIAPNSCFAQKTGLDIVEGPEKHQTTLFIDSDSEFPIDFLHFNIPDDIEEFKVDIEFKIFMINDDDKYDKRIWASILLG
ncbi:MAG: sulfatase-like hydrolase/transferase [Bacteroidetes bacterium]|nr:sulfatase-like hydrolase/transferase [Bacteroidota bacterium]MCL1968982.1 sulfatase-like hydrolase/transferase [Bacteroidota bacterium]